MDTDVTKIKCKFIQMLLKSQFCILKTQQGGIKWTYKLWTCTALLSICIRQHPHESFIIQVNTPGILGLVLEFETMFL